MDIVREVMCQGCFLWKWRELDPEDPRSWDPAMPATMRGDLQDEQKAMRQQRELFKEVEREKRRIEADVSTVRREYRIHEHLGYEMAQIQKERAYIMEKVNRLDSDMTSAFSKLLSISSKAGPVGAEVLGYETDEAYRTQWGAMRHTPLEPPPTGGHLMETCHACWRESGIRCHICARTDVLDTWKKGDRMVWVCT